MAMIDEKRRELIRRVEETQRLRNIERQAREEFERESFQEAVRKRKEELRTRSKLPWYRKVFPFRITIERI